MNIISKTRHAYQINVREYRRVKKKDNPEKQATQGRQDEENTTKTQHYMCWTPLYANGHK